MWLLCVKQARIPADTRHTHLQASYCQVQSELLELPVETVKGWDMRNMSSEAFFGLLCENFKIVTLFSSVFFIF